MRKRTLVVSEWSTFQEEGTGIARALGQAWACVYEEQEEDHAWGVEDGGEW